jgi:putative membrane protein
MRHSIWSLALGAALACAATAAAQETPNQGAPQTAHDMPPGMGQPSTTDRKFVQKAMRGGLAEVKLGQLAADRGTSAEVRELGQRMVRDHGKANGELAEIARTKGIALPTDLDANDQANVDRLSKLTGKAFDRAYIATLVKAHDQDTAAFERASTELADPDLRAFARRALPALRQHDDLARRAERRLM